MNLEEKVLKLIEEENQPLTTNEIVEKTGKTRARVKYILQQMVSRQLVDGKQSSKPRGPWIWWKKDFFKTKQEKGNLFRDIIVSLLIKKNYKIQIEAGLKGKKVDILIEENKKKIPVEVKTIVVNPNMLNQLEEYMKIFNSKKGWFVTSEKFSPDCYEKAKRLNIKLLDFNEIKKELIENDLEREFRNLIALKETNMGIGYKHITITLDENLIKNIDKMVDGIKIRSRSHIINILMEQSLRKMLGIKNVLILAGGNRKEMGELTKNTPRSMLLIKGKPILQHIIERLQSFNITQYIIYIDYLGEQIMNYFGDGSSFGVKIEYLMGDKPKDTIYPLTLVRKKIKDTFLVVYGDTISSIDITDFLEFHRKNQNLATVALTSVSNPKDYGVINLNGNKITMFKEKPINSTNSYLVSSGMFIFEPRIFNYISKQMKSMEKDLFPKLVKKNILSGYPFQGLWLNINTSKDLKKARIII